MICSCIQTSEIRDPWPNVPMVHGDALDRWANRKVQLERSILLQEERLQTTSRPIFASCELRATRNQLLTASENIFFACIARLKAVLSQIEEGQESLSLTKTIQALTTDVFLNSVYQKALEQSEILRNRETSEIGRALQAAKISSIRALYAQTILKQAKIFFMAHPRQLVFNKSGIQNRDRSNSISPNPLPENIAPMFVTLDQQLQTLTRGRQARLALEDQLDRNQPSTPNITPDSSLCDEETKEEAAQNTEGETPSLHPNSIQAIFDEISLLPSSLPPTGSQEYQVYRSTLEKTQNTVLQVWRHLLRAENLKKTALLQITRIEAQHTQKNTNRVHIEG